MGAGWDNCRRTNATPIIIPAMSSAAAAHARWPLLNASTEMNRRLNVSAQRIALFRSKGCPDPAVRGNVRMEIPRARIPTGTFTANSKGHEAMDYIPAARVGPRADENATAMAFIPIPLPSILVGKMVRTSAVFTLTIPEAPNPWMHRASVKVTSE